MATLHIDKIIAEKVNQDDLIRLLETVIDEEMQRPEAEMNCDLIDQCVDALLEMRQDRDHLAVMVPLMQDKAFLHLIQRKAGNTARLNGAARGALIAAAILASTISVNAMVDAAFDYNILEHIGKAISASVLGPEIIGGEDDVDEPTTVPGATEKSESTTASERTTANGETTTRQPEQTTTAAAVTQPNTTTPTTTEREQESTTKKEPTTKKVTGDNVHHKPTQPDRPEETTKAVRVIGFNAQLGESFKSHYIYGEQLSYDGLTLTADWSDGTTKPVALKNCTYTTQVNMNRTADVTLHILYKGFLVEIPITVRPNEETRESTICQTDRYDYLLCKAGAYITAYRGTAKELICNVVDGNRIFAIADSVFEKHTELESLILPYVTLVGDNAFRGCTALATADLPSVVQVGENAFAGCTALEEWTAGENLATIGSRALAQSALRTLSLGSKVTAVPEGLCYDCNLLERVDLEGRVTEIGAWAFEGCEALQTVTGTENLRTVGDYAFSDCQQVVPNTVQQMGRMAFAGSALTEVSVVSGVKTLGDYAFAGCHATFRLPMSLTEMGKYPLGFTASESDGNVTVFKMDDVNVIAPAASESIRYAKENDLKYKMIGPEDTDFNEENYLYGTVGDGDWYFDKRTGALSTNATNVGTKQGFYFTNGQLWKYKQAGVRSVHLLNGVKNLGDIFAGITTLEQVTATDSLTNINTDAFVGCTGLKSVSLPAVTKIGANSFADCTALQTVDLPLAATISDHAFQNCTALQFLELPAVTKITSTAFAGCTGLTDLTLGKGAAVIDDRAFTDCKALTNLDLGSTVSIGREAFAGCTALATISLPDSVTRLGVGAFRNCTGATGIEIGSGLTEVPAFAFADCTGVKDIAFDEGVVTIGPNAFQNAVSVVFLTLPNSVTTVGSRAFAGLLNVEKITLGSGLTKVESYAFDNAVNCYQLTLDSAVNALTNADMVACHLAYYGGQKPMIPGAGMAYSVEGYNSFRRIGENTAGLAVVVGDHATALSMHFLAAQTDKVKRVTLGKQVQRIGYEIKKGYPADYTKAFAAEFIGNGYLEQVTVSSENPYLYADGSGLYSKDKSTLYAAVTGKGDYTENTASAIGDWALSCNAKLKKVTLGKSVRTVGTKAFAYDQKLKYVQLTDGLQQIGASAFTGCTALKVLELPDTVTTLGNNVFENCTALASVLLSGGLTALPTYAFRNCTALTGVVVPDSVAAFNPGAFADCKALTEVYIGSQSTRYVQLGTNRTHVFARCPALTVYTMAGSDAAVYAKTRNIPTKLYTDADAFADLCAMKRDIYAGYLGFCTDGHGDIQWLTVYAADCTHDGYAIGVCEYCSAILEERHTTATGHNYVVSETPAADGRDGVRITTCQNCGDSSYTVLPGSGTAVEETHTVTGTVVLAADRAATKGTHAAIGADVLLNGYTLATTDEKGNFSLQLKSGTYALTVRYAYGFSRTLYVVVSDRDLQCGSVPVIGCDWNKDGKIDDQDYYMFKLIFGTHQGQAGYLSYVDMNHDGMINTRDMIFVERCMGLQAGSFAYTPLVIR